MRNRGTVVIMKSSVEWVYTEYSNCSIFSVLPKAFDSICIEKRVWPASTWHEDIIWPKTVHTEIYLNLSNGVQDVIALLGWRLEWYRIQTRRKLLPFRVKFIPIHGTRKGRTSFSSWDFLWEWRTQAGYEDFDLCPWIGEWKRSLVSHLLGEKKSATAMAPCKLFVAVKYPGDWNECATEYLALYIIEV